MKLAPLFAKVTFPKEGFVYSNIATQISADMRRCANEDENPSATRNCATRAVTRARASACRKGVFREPPWLSKAIISTYETDAHHTQSGLRSVPGINCNFVTLLLSRPSPGLSSCARWNRYDTRSRSRCTISACETMSNKPSAGSTRDVTIIILSITNALGRLLSMRYDSRSIRREHGARNAVVRTELIDGAVIGVNLVISAEDKRDKWSKRTGYLRSIHSCTRVVSHLWIYPRDLYRASFLPKSNEIAISAG